ncbi:MAG: hypothetical protein KGL39_51905 [Patescibacteria group bacterium]|nr:hypothetical protein [Patescibacteria group bacterium]
MTNDKNRPVDPRTDWDDSHYIDIIDSERDRWDETSPCTTPTDEDTDEAINRAFGFPPSGALRSLSTELADWSEDDIRAAVRRGLDAWYGVVDVSAVEHYDQLLPLARREYRENTLVGDARDGDCISVATAEQLDAIDAGRKAPCLA